MNKKQKRLSYITVIVMLLTLLWPPYTITNHNHIVKETGYHFLFTLSEVKDHFAAKVNTELLFIELLVVIIGYIILFFAFKEKNGNPVAEILKERWKQDKKGVSTGI